ncbi:hypothetical protein BD324DRAFT_620773 [Kockovaella imperatae]|uniref:NmrA-like domain-containing protein n=1 Tax=Kockovaella imperatae TaxID=4999 RepID=A0A1Y1UMQ5_9TREE|nr:hypothetical protein BD324DRAFT_620773 [Kockovaella imperatae]ORX38415.1 hypothetical protein BD324DRAFT_620773 [Kockovaella imperatae]
MMYAMDRSSQRTLESPDYKKMTDREHSSSTICSPRLNSSSYSHPVIPNMVVTIGLYNHNGMIGSQILKHLLTRAQQGSIRLVVLHRRTSNTNSIPEHANIEKRVVDLETPDKKLNEKSVKGIHVLISAASNKDRIGRAELVETLASSDDLITFVPTDYGLVWTNYLPKWLNLGFVKGKAMLDERAKSLGINLTNFRSGCQTPWMFTRDHGDFGINVKGNYLIRYGDTMQKRLPITSPAWLGEKVAEIVSSHDPHQLADRSFSLVETWATGNEIKEAFTRIHGKEPAVQEIDEQHFQEKMDKGISESMGAGIWLKWRDNNWEFDGEMINGTRSVEELAREQL